MLENTIWIVVVNHMFHGGEVLLSDRTARAVGEHWSQLLKVRAISRDALVIELSGGKQQMAVIAKALVQESELIIFDEPRRSVNVGAIAEIHAEIKRLADAGRAVVEFSPLDATQEGIFYAAIH